MAHGITSTDSFGEVRKNGKKAWHGLGMEIPEGLSAEDGFRQIGLNWETRLEPVYAEILGNKVELKEHRVHVRQDTGDILGLVSDHYQKIDNLEMAKFVDALLGEDAALTLETGGSLYGGKRVFALARLPKTLEVVPGDVVKPYVCVSNGHGGFASFIGMVTEVRVVCRNTLTMAERDMSRGFKFRHMGNLDAKIAQARTLLGLANEQHLKFAEQAKALVNTDLSVGQIRDFMDAAWIRLFGELPDAVEQPEAHAKMAEKRNETIMQWLRNLENERNTLAGMRGTAWAAFNAITEWSDHQRGRFGAVADSEARAHSNLFGVSNVGKVKVLQQALSLV